MFESLLIQLLINGREQTERGWSVIFCPVCRDLRPASAARTRHDLVFLLGLYSRTWSAHTELTCPTCAATCRRPWEHHLRDPQIDVLLSDGKPDPLDLLDDADEDYITQLNERLDLEQRRIERCLRPGERELLLAEPFVELQHIGTDSGAMHIPTLTGLAIIGLVFAVPFTLLLLAVLPASITLLVSLLIFLFLAGLIVLDLRFLKSWRRSESLYTLLARSLAPLVPTDEELRQTLAALRAERRGKAGRVRLHPLRRQLHRLATTSTHSVPSTPVLN